MRNERFSIKARVGSRASASAYLKQPGDAVIVDRHGPRWLILSCPCGCGAEVPVNLDRRAGPAWRLYESPKGTSVYPSVWRDTDCKSHFIIWRDDILLFGERYGESWIDEAESGEQELLQRVLEALSSREQSAEEISDQIPDSEPWDVLRCCRRLCKLGKAIEGRHHTRGRFRRLE
jgi:Family of unknown function (DUF6527)